MLGIGAGGFGEGLLAGLNTAARLDGLQREQAADDRRSAIAEARLAHEDRLAQQRQAMAEQELQLNREKLAAETAYQEGVLGQKQTEETNAQQQAEAKLRMDERELGMKEQWYGAQAKNLESDNELNRAKLEAEKDAKEIAAARARMPGYSQALLTGGSLPAEFVDDFKKGIGFSPALVLGPQAQEIDDTFNAVKAGQLDINDPRAHNAFSAMYEDVLTRPIGNPVMRDGKQLGTITGTELAQVRQTKDGKLAFGVKVDWKDANGKPQEPYEAPLTLYRSSSPNDPMVLVDPMKIERDAAGLMYLRRLVESSPQARQSLIAVMDAVAKRDQKAKGGGVSIQKTFDATTGKENLIAVDKDTLTAKPIAIEGGQSALDAGEKPEKARELDATKKKALFDIIGH